jgi:twitching motility protein PilT
MPDIEAYLKQMVARQASDLLIVAETPPTVRVSGELQPLAPEKLTASEARHLIYSLMNPEQIERFESAHELDFSRHHPELGRFRVNVHYQKGAVSAAIRHLATNIPRFEQLGLPDAVREFATKRNGLVLVTGPAGSGKSTTLAALIHLINTSRACHIITIEDPIEYVHTSEKSVVEQREVLTDTHSFAQALKHVLRQSPDVILIGEMRDLETISTALTAAETGHLVLATLHTIDACQTIDRIIDGFPADQQYQIRTQLSMALQGIIAQILLPRADGRGQVVAVEVMRLTPAISAAIRANKTSQIYSSIQTGKAHGMQTRDQALRALVEAGVIDYETALPFVKDLSYFKG